jgi:hypothetical protein
MMEQGRKPQICVAYHHSAGVTAYTARTACRLLYKHIYVSFVIRDSVTDIATRYELDSPGIES